MSDSINPNDIPENVLYGCLPEPPMATMQRKAYHQATLDDYDLLGADNLPTGYMISEDDPELQRFLDARINFFQKRYESLDPVTDIKNWKDWNQSQYNGTCTSMGFTHAAQATQGYNYLYGSPLVNEAFNPMYLYMRGKNFRYSDGELLWTFAKNMVEIGSSPVRLAGDDCVNRKVTSTMWEKTNAGDYQSSICELTTIDNVERFLKAGFGIAFGTSYIPMNFDVEGNITKTASGGHCMGLIGWHFDKELAYLQNSYGAVYRDNRFGGFMKRSLLSKLNMFGRYGNPVAIIATEYKLIELRK